jgi:Holliday junction resolvasome RuvABC endonuclease subunit
MAIKTIEEIKEEFAGRGYDYLEGEYKNLDSPLTVKCKKGHEIIISLSKVRKDPTCPVCEMYSQIENEEHKLDVPPRKEGMRILALDNATIKSGYAIFEGENLLTSGVKEIDSKLDGIQRIAHIKEWLISIIKLWEIDVVGLEDVYYSGNAQTLIVLSKLLGVLENTAYELTSGVYVVGAGTWRKHCGIKGRKREVRKENAQKYVKENFGIIASQDKADAICLGSYVLSRERFGEIVKW